MNHDAIAVVDFGGQYAHLIASKVRREGVLAEILQPEDSVESFKKYKGIIFSGSPSLSAFNEDSLYNKEIFDLDIPILGFCFGHQEVAKHYGGKVINGKKEWGRADLHILKDHPLFKGLDSIQQVWMSHNDTVSEIGEEFEELGYSKLGKNGEPHHFAAIGSDKLRRYGLQYHPEVDDSINGHIMLRNFAIEICGCKPTWDMDAYIKDEINKVHKQVGDRSVFLLASGGVDSTVAAKVLGEALGSDRLSLLHVDNGLMRKDESQRVLEAFKEMGLGNNLHFVDASDDFLSALEGLVEPEDKRKAIGNCFVEVFEREAKRLGLENHLLGQGTIYPDTVETGGTKRADTIKTHHNRVPVIEEMIAAGKVVEPLADLYKVEVRELGEKLEIPHDMIWRHPFPGPGLGVRLLCSNGEVNISQEELNKFTAAATEFADKYNLKAVTLPIKSVGVKADLRTYEHPVMLHGDANWEELQEVSGLIFKSIEGINRAIWNLGANLPTNFKLLPATMTKERLDLLREADHLVMDGLTRHNLHEKIWQCPTVLVPLEIDGVGKELCIIRPIRSARGMSAVATELPLELLSELKESVLALDGISGLALDLTSKPPGTIEWE